jgi:hypothetical protein
MMKKKFYNIEERVEKADSIIAFLGQSYKTFAIVKKAGLFTRMQPFILILTLKGPNSHHLIFFKTYNRPK